MVKLSRKKLKEFIADEKKGASEYRKYGFDKLASDESRHRRFLKNELKKMDLKKKLKKMDGKKSKKKTKKKKSKK